MNDRTEKKPTDLEVVEELYRFLQGEIPEGYQIRDERLPRLTPDQAWTVVWYLGNLYRQIPDRIERCELCGDIYDTWQEGETNDHRPGPVFVCGMCINSEEAQRQRRIGRKLERNRERLAAARKANRKAATT